MTFNNLTPIDPGVAINKIYGRCRDDAYIGWGSRYSPNDKRDPFPHYSSIIPVLGRGTYVPEHLSSEACTSYIAPNSFMERVLLGKSPEDFINSYQEWCKGERKQPLFYRAKNFNIYELTSIFVDLDVGRKKSDHTADEAIREVLKMSNDSEVPLPSMFAKSGRGVYVIYLLKESGSDLVPLKDEAEEVWKKCQGKFHQSFGHLEVDGNAGRLCNWYKAPGTVDTKTDNTVVYLTNGVNGVGDMPVYTLEGLAESQRPEFPEQEMISVEPFYIPDDPDTAPSDHPPMQYPEQTADGTCLEPAGAVAILDEKVEFDDNQLAQVRSKRFPKRVHVIKAGLEKTPLGAGPDIQRCLEIEAINEYRCGLKADTCRYWTCYYYYRMVRSVLLRLGKPIKEAEKIARQWTHELNDSFDPPLEKGEVSDAFNGDAMILQNDYMARTLRVTEKEAVQLGLKSIIPQNVRERREAEAQRLKDQKKMIRESVDRDLAAGTKPADIIKSLKELEGLEISHQYIDSRKRKLTDVVDCN